MSNLDALQQDALREAFNIGMGRAADSLSQLLGQEVHITIPDLLISPKRETIDSLSGRLEESVRTVSQHFWSALDTEEMITGEVFLFFSQDASQKLSQIMLGNALSPDAQENERMVLQETGNILLNACMGSVANLLDGELHCEIPDVYLKQPLKILLDFVRRKRDPAKALKQQERRKPQQVQDRLVKLTIAYRTESPKVEGQLMMVMDLSTMPTLNETLTSMVQRLLAGD
uniref:CheC-like protein domain-containing protein n=1 Tax=Magnetococcus massalia (strain MO-1) TaxID=451514 RepID=A0A1S7LF27_MAGMO|nr:protein of unknown function[Include CheC-like domain] [Candidatus Magnetococcus massalia]